jgi:hypothetical protein
MLGLSIVYKFFSGFSFLASIYFALNFVTRHEERTVVASLALLYSSTRFVSAIRMLASFRKIERLEMEAKAAASFDPAKGLARWSTILDVAQIRREGELRGYMELLFQGIIAIICISRLLIN